MDHREHFSKGSTSPRVRYPKGKDLPVKLRGLWDPPYLGEANAVLAGIPKQMLSSALESFGTHRKTVLQLGSACYTI